MKILINTGKNINISKNYQKLHFPKKTTVGVLADGFPGNTTAKEKGKKMLVGLAVTTEASIF